VLFTVGVFVTGLFGLLWVVPVVVLSAMEWGAAELVRPNHREDYRRTVTLAHVPLAVAIVGSAASVVGGELVGGVTIASIGLAVAGGFLLSAVLTRRSSWKRGGPIGLSFIALNAIVAMLVVAFLPVSLTGVFWD
jgi:hypothetical protein